MPFKKGSILAFIENEDHYFYMFYYSETQVEFHLYQRTNVDSVLLTDYVKPTPVDIEDKDAREGATVLEYLRLLDSSLKIPVDTLRIWMEDIERGKPELVFDDIKEIYEKHKEKGNR